MWKLKSFVTELKEFSKDKKVLKNKKGGKQKGGKTINICDGCNVREGHEHRCHRKYIVINGEFTNKTCECPQCREADELLQNLKKKSEQ